MHQTKGYIHIYTGDGKGKTTAAIGLAIRAAGAGKRVYIAQFVKGMKYSELNVLLNIPQIRIEQFGTECFIIKQPEPKDIENANKGLCVVKEIIENHTCDVLILDELCIALHFKLFELESVLSLIDIKPYSMELIITGRNAPDKLIERADLVSEIREIKHYYQKGIQAREGIEY
jgi:cob(I)alamin adenosyltransferase